MDGRIVDGLRNFLFDPPVGMDLAAINVARGHDLGLGTLNETRAALGLTPTPRSNNSLAMTLVDIDQDRIKLLGVDHVSASDFLFHV